MAPVIVALSFVLSLLIAFLGRKKKLGFWGFLFASLLLTPLLGLLLLIVCKPAQQASSPHGA